MKQGKYLSYPRKVKGTGEDSQEEKVKKNENKENIWGARKVKGSKEELTFPS